MIPLILVIALITPIIHGYDLSQVQYDSIVSTGAKCDILMYIYNNRIVKRNINELGLPKLNVKVSVKYNDENGVESKNDWIIDFQTNPHATVFFGDKGNSLTTIELTDEGCVYFFSGRFENIKKDDISVQGDSTGFKILTTFTKLIAESVNKRSRQLFYEMITSPIFKPTAGLKSEPLLWYIFSQINENMEDYYKTRGVIQLSVKPTGSNSQVESFYFVFNESGPDLIKNGDFEAAAIDLVLNFDDASLVKVLLNKSGWVDVLMKYGKDATQFSM